MYKTINKYNTLIHILECNPKTQEIVLVATDGNKLSTVPNIQNQWMLDNGYSRVGAINGGFFQGNGYPCGWELTDFNYLHSEGWNDKTVDIFFKDGKLIVDNVGLSEFNSKYKGKVQWGLSGSYGLVVNGKVNTLLSSYHSNSLTYNPRTFVGQKSDGTVLLMVCDGRNKNNSKGLTASQQAQVCLDLGCVNAVNLDGGGSSTLEYNGTIKNSPTDGSLRKVANAIVVYEKKTVVDKPVEGGNSVKNGKVIALDFGHGGSDSGATGNGLFEKDITLEIGLKVKNRLIANGFDVITLRESDSYVGDASERGKKLGQTKANYALSIHVNSASANTATGAELIVPCKETYGNIEYFIQEEFRKTGKWRKICSRHYTTGTFHNRTINATTKRFEQTVNATDYYGVCREAWKLGVSADIIELFFINNKVDVDNYLSKKDKYVEAIVKSICLGFGFEYKEEVKLPVVDENPQDTTQYRVIVATMTGREKATILQQELVANGYKDTWLMVK